MAASEYNRDKSRGVCAPGEVHAALQPQAGCLCLVTAEQGVRLVDHLQRDPRECRPHGGQGFQEIVQPFELLQLADEQQSTVIASGRLRDAIEYRRIDAVGNHRHTLGRRSSDRA